MVAWKVLRLAALLEYLKVDELEFYLVGNLAENSGFSSVCYLVAWKDNDWADSLVFSRVELSGTISGLVRVALKDGK
jgi:hypothetical protein